MTLRRLPLVALAVLPWAVSPAGCGPEEIKVKQVSAADAPPAPPQPVVKPKAGSSGGMNYNPGGPPPGSAGTD